MEILNAKEIGVFHSCYKDKFGTPRQSGLIPESTGFIEISQEYQPELSLSGLESFSHLWVLFWFHRSNVARFHAKVHPPRLEGKTMGLFATRSPHRPNPIGLSLVEIVQVTPEGIHVRGIDIVDGTPVLDIKPYLPEIEAVHNAKSGWTTGIVNPVIQVVWSDSVTPPEDTNLKILIEKTIQLDPRPMIYKFGPDTESKYRDQHAVRIENVDVSFQFVELDRAIIQEIKTIIF